MGGDRTMWNRFQGEEEADGDIPEDKAVDVEAEEVMTVLAPTVVTKRLVPREFHITEKDAERHGYSRGCLGCASWFRGVRKQQLHTAECRERFHKQISDDTCTVGRPEKEAPH